MKPERMKIYKGMMKSNYESLEAKITTEYEYWKNKFEKLPQIKATCKKVENSGIPIVYHTVTQNLGLFFDNADYQWTKDMLDKKIRELGVEE